MKIVSAVVVEAHQLTERHERVQTHQSGAALLTNAKQGTIPQRLGVAFVFGGSVETRREMEGGFTCQENAIALPVTAEHRMIPRRLRIIGGEAREMLCSPEL